MNHFFENIRLLILCNYYLPLI